MRIVLTAAAALAAAAPNLARASFLAGETLDTAANWLSWFVIVVIPIAAIGAFFYVHILPELIAERRQHPHKESIKVLCILSLFFGGMLWPFAWLWAYTRPMGWRAVYGTEKHEDYYVEMGEKARRGELSHAEIAHLRDELRAIAAKSALPPKLRDLPGELDALEAAPVVSTPAPPSPPRPARALEATGGGGA